MKKDPSEFTEFVKLFHKLPDPNSIPFPDLVAELVAPYAKEDSMTLTTLQAYLASAPTRTVRGEVWRKVLPQITCADGFTLSVQASRNHYCSPKDDVGPWTQVEVGFPSAEEPLLMEYSTPDSEVYGNVPLSLVAEVIDRHGGFERYFKTKEERDNQLKEAARYFPTTKEEN